MKSMYQCPGMVAYPVSTGPYPLFDVAGHSYFFGYMPTADAASQPLYTFSPPGKYYGNHYYGDYCLEHAFEGISLNPTAQEFVPTGHAAWSPTRPAGPEGADHQDKPKVTPYRPPRPSKVQNFFSVGRGDVPSWRQRTTGSPEQRKPSSPQNKEGANSNNVKKTCYITDVDQQVTEEQLALFFKDCGDVVDCRVCGDPNSAMRFAFVEFFTEEAAEAAIKKNGAVLGDFPLRILPSKTAIVPVNNQYLPKNSTEREQCSRTIYAANIDKKVDRECVKLFFETLCGPVAKIRLLGDWQHATRIAFVEFVKADSAKTALSCSGALLGSLPVRVSPSKTPVRDDPTLHDKQPSPTAAEQ